MSLKRRIENLEGLSKEGLKEEVFAVFQRYGNNPELFVNEATSYEKELVWRWAEPQLEEEYAHWAEMFLPDALRLFLERWVYPIVLCGSKEDEDAGVVLGVDHLWLQVAYLDLWKRFIADIKNTPSPEEDPEGFGNHRLSAEICEEFKQAQRRLDLFKHGLRAKIAAEDEEDARRCAEENED